MEKVETLKTQYSEAAHALTFLDFTKSGNAGLSYAHVFQKSPLSNKEQDCPWISHPFVSTCSVPKPLERHGKA